MRMGLTSISVSMLITEDSDSVRERLFHRVESSSSMLAGDNQVTRRRMLERKNGTGRFAMLGWSEKRIWYLGGVQRLYLE